MQFIAHPGASYGWRARLGLLQPRNVSDTNPYEFYLMAPDGVQLVLTSLGLTGPLTQEKYDQAVENIAGPIGLLEARGVDSIVQAGIPPIVTRGWGFEEEVLKRVRSITSIPFATDIGSSLLAWQALDVEKVVMISGFDDEMQDPIPRYAGRGGLEVLAAASMRTDSREDLDTLPLETVYRAARSLYLKHADDAEGIWITGAFMPSVAVIDTLEQDLGVPVVTSAQAMMWQGLRLAGINHGVEGFGSLFDM